MYPSNGYANTSFPDNNTNPSLGIQDFSSSSSCLFHFPSPYIQYEDDAVYLHQLHDILYQNDQDVVDTNENVIENTATSSKNETNMEEHLCAKEGTTNYQPVAKRKKPKKDRHSKINTALGPRDRRMRLSLDVAQKFFGLQDMLGFDKASKTVEWLLKQSKIAIKELTKGLNQMNKSSSIVSASSTSDCEVMSGLIEESIQQNAKTKIVLPSSCTEEKRTRRVRKPTFPPLAKESRIKARERARDRTKEKKKQQQLDDQQPINLVSRTSFGTGKESASTSQNTIDYINTPPSLEVQEMTNTREQQKPSQGTREETGDSNLFITRNWCPSGFFDYQHGFGTPHKQQFTEFQFYGYNN